VITPIKTAGDRDTGSFKTTVSKNLQASPMQPLEASDETSVDAQFEFLQSRQQPLAGVVTHALQAHS
jgi:hypothetical protein